jgi:DNA-binding LacI/PurR family transcriptional regulator
MMRRRGLSTARPTLEEVARHAGVSRATVSRVVNDSPTVAPHLREIVDRAVAELGYVPNQAARTLMTSRTDTIALVVAEPDTRVFSDPFFSDIVRGVSQELAASGLQLMLMMAQSHADLARIEQYLVSRHVDGVLLISEHADDRLPRALAGAGVPLVIGGRPLQAATATAYVDNDNIGGARTAAEYLRSSGRSRITTIAGPVDMSAGVDRLAGFRKGLGREFRARHVEYGNFEQEGGAAAMARLLDRVPDLDAVFVASDLMALGALAELRRRGRRVPDDVAVVGFDDITMAALAEPSLTTMRQRTVDQGRLMVRLYLALHRPELLVPDPGGALPDVVGTDRVVLPVELVVRESA